MRALALLLSMAALAGAGCLSPLSAAPGQVMVCLEKGLELTWREPDSGGRFAEAARRAGWNVTTEAPAGGFPGPKADAALSGLWWRADGQPRVTLLPGETPGTVVFGMSAPADRAESERIFLDFLGHVGLADAPGREAWMDALFPETGPEGASAGPAFRQMEARAEPDLSEPLAALRDAPLAPTALGEARMAAGAWEAHVRLPVHAVKVPGGPGAPTLWADDQGSFRARIPVKDITEGMRPLHVGVQDAFAALALPPPTFRDGSGGAVGC
jgi:hypothetical protein